MFGLPDDCTQNQVFSWTICEKKTFLGFNRHGCFFFEYCWKEKKKETNQIVVPALDVWQGASSCWNTQLWPGWNWARAERSNVDTGAILNAIHHKRMWCAHTSLRLCLTADHRPTKRFLFTLLSRCILSKILIKTKAFSRFGFLFCHVAAVV